MSAEQSTSALREAAAQILESAAFVFVEDLMPEMIPHKNKWSAQGVRIQYVGTPTGQIDLWVGEGLAKLLAMNMLGLEDDSPELDTRAPDALKECLNMICGIFLTANYGEEPIYSLTIPELISDSEPSAESAELQCLWLDAEGHAVLICHRSLA